MKIYLNVFKNIFKGTLFIFLFILISSKDLIAKSEFKNEIIVAQRADAKTLDPQKSIDTISNRVINTMFESLLFIDENLKIVPSLAKSWKRLDDLTTIFYLKENIYFHSGHHMTSEDVIFSLNRARESIQTGYYYSLIENIIPLDKYTIKITTSKPFGAMFNYLASSGSSIVCKKSVLSLGEKFAQSPIGTGPYKFKKWIPGEMIVLEKFNKYHKELTNNKNLIIKIVPEVTNRTIALETGEADIAFDIGTLDRSFLKSHNDLKLIEVDAPSILYLGFDKTNPLFSNNLKLRQAIAYAIDNKVLADIVFMGGATPADSPMPPIVPGYNSNIKKYNQNVELAKTLLNEAGYPSGLNLDLWITNQSTWIDIATIIQDQVKQIGINLNIKIFEWGAYVSKTAFPKKSLYLLSWNVSSIDGDPALYPLFHSEEKGGSGNRSFYDNTKVDSLLLKARTTADQIKRHKLYGQVQEIIQEELPHYTLVYPKYNLGAKKSVENLILQKNGYVNLAKIYIKN